MSGIQIQSTVSYFHRAMSIHSFPGMKSSQFLPTQFRCRQLIREGSSVNSNTRASARGGGGGFPVHFWNSEYLEEFTYTFILLTLFDDSFSTANLYFISTTNANSVCCPPTTKKCICNSVMNYRKKKEQGSRIETTYFSLRLHCTYAYVA